MRVYLPATSTVLVDLARTRQLDPPLTAFAVTPELREWYVDDAQEELEYAALLEAARGSLRLIDADDGAARRRVVIALDAPDDGVEIRDDLDRGVVRIGVTVGLAGVASIHVDDADAADVVASAAAAVIAADLGDQSSIDAVDDAEGFELAWYATQELEDLLAALG